MDRGIAACVLIGTGACLFDVEDLQVLFGAHLSGLHCEGSPYLLLGVKSCAG